jgi:ferric hydroxamate transport system ATP-binding protein
MTIKTGATSAVRDTRKPLFRLTNVSVETAGASILDQVTMELPVGEFIGIIGHNGSGKSTLLKVLSGQAAVSSGDVRFAGRPISDWRLRDLARQLAYLPQVTPPAQDMLVRELVALGRYPWHGALSRLSAEDRHKVSEAIELTGLEGLARRQVDTLSGGERQRAWLAMMIAQDARCWLLDEPTSALDLAHQVSVLGLVRRIAEKRSISVVMVLHDINMAARYCHTVVPMRRGKVLGVVSPHAIMKRDALRQIYDIEMEIITSSAGDPVALPIRHSVTD